MFEQQFSPIGSYDLTTDKGVPQSAIDTLNTDGVVCLRQVLDGTWLKAIEEGIELALNGASTNFDLVERKNEGSFSFSSGAWSQVEPFRRVIFDSHFADVAWALLSSKQLVLFYDFLLIKQPLCPSAATPWHQDHSYYPLDGIDVINCWVALDDIPYESALRFFKASHRSAQLFRPIDFDNPDRDYRHARNHLPLPPDDQKGDSVLCSELKAGDMLAWKSYTVHSAPGNSLDRRRAAFSVNWLGDDAVYNGADSLETYKHPSQVIGRPITCEKFPLVRGG